MSLHTLIGRIKAKKLAFFGVGLLMFVPELVFAAPAPGFGQIGTTISLFIDFINGYLVPLVFALAFFMFLWGMFKFFFLSYSNEEGRSDGKQLMIWAVAAFVVMVSIWGLVNFLAQSLGFYVSSPPILPSVPIPGVTGGGGAPASAPTFPQPAGIAPFTALPN